MAFTMETTGLRTLIHPSFLFPLFTLPAWVPPMTSLFCLFPSRVLCAATLAWLPHHAHCAAQCAARDRLPAGAASNRHQRA